MKLNFSKILLAVLLCLGGVLLCLGLYFLVDRVMNGAFVDWFEGNYMITENQYLEEAGCYVLMRQPNYPKLKGLLLTVLTAAVVLFFLAAQVYAQSRVKRSLRRSALLVRRFMQSDQEASAVFPAEYVELSAQMTEIRSTIQRHEQTLREESSRKNDLIAYLAHDLKTPLTSIIGYLSLLEEAPDMPADQRDKYTRITLDKSLRLESLINEFFDITRYNLQKIELERESIDLYYMLVQLTDEFYPLLNDHQNTVELSADESITLYGDANKLARVFNNLLKNAIAYSYPRTPIRISAEKTQDQVTVCFSNQGNTIPANKLADIFEKFFRLDDARTSNTGGAGLGLAIAREIVTLHGGTITASSQEQVTTFQVSLPLPSFSKVS